LATYLYRCSGDGDFEVRRPIGTAPEPVSCPACGGDAVRVYTAPMLSTASRAAVAAIDRAEKSRDQPDVVTTLPARPARRRPAAPANPALQKLPRP
jgi:putative FmdB family regulatory protein